MGRFFQEHPLPDPSMIWSKGNTDHIKQNVQDLRTVHVQLIISFNISGKLFSEFYLRSMISYRVLDCWDQCFSGHQHNLLFIFLFCPPPFLMQRSDDDDRHDSRRNRPSSPFSSSKLEKYTYKVSSTVIWFGSEKVNSYSQNGRLVASIWGLCTANTHFIILYD